MIIQLKMNDEPEELPVTEQMNDFRSADVVRCPHGAYTANSLYMRAGSPLNETFGKTWFCPCCVETAACSGVRYFPVTETPDARQEMDGIFRDHTIDMQLLEQTVRGRSCTRAAADGRGMI